MTDVDRQMGLRGRRRHIRRHLDRVGMAGREAELHRRFAHLRIRGEWFRFEGELFEYVTKLDSEKAVAA